MKKTKIRSLAAALALLLFLSCTLAVPAAAAHDNRLEIAPVTDKSVAAKSAVPIRHPALGIKLSGILIGDTTYIPLRSFASLLGASSWYNSAARTTTVAYRGMTLTVTDGDPYILASGRPIFAMRPNVIMSDGRMYVPIRSLCTAFGISVGWDAATRSVSLSGTPCAYPAAHYNADDLWWLSRIISAEAKGEPLLGQVAVGNVVLNRVKSSLYPNSIWGVIFDKKYGWQFTPAMNGTVYQTPTASAILAAKICLEGYTLSPDVLFFLEPTISTSSWIPKSRRYLYTVGHHDFYA